MANAYLEPKPGTAIKIMTEEHMYLDEFMEMMKQKLHLDQKYFEDMKSLRSTWNAKWAGSGIWPLISPVLQYIGEEITLRDNLARDLASRLADLPNTPILGAYKEGSFDPLEMPESLEEAFEEYERCHKVVMTPETQKELKGWAGEGKTWANYLLPQSDRDYRKAVVKHQRTAGPARKWYQENIPRLLERHQQRAEDVKRLLQGALNNESGLAFDLSASCSTAIRSTALFASTEYVGPRHIEVEAESTHIFLQNFDYRNFMTDGSPSQPRFGLGTLETAALIHKIVDSAIGSTSLTLQVGSGNPEDVAFQMEKDSLSDRILSYKGPILSAHRWRGDLIMFACVSDPPMLKVSPELINRYSKGVPRDKLRPVIEMIVPLVCRDILLQVVISLHVFRPETSSLYLAHSRDAKPIIDSIWSKWDLGNDCPFPSGIERMYDKDAPNEWKVVWKKTRELYLAPAVNSA